MSDLLNDRRDVIDEYEDEKAAKRLTIRDASVVFFTTIPPNP
jgi:hypothetical protein